MFEGDSLGYDPTLPDYDDVVAEAGYVRYRHWLWGGVDYTHWGCVTMRRGQIRPTRLHGVSPESHEPVCPRTNTHAWPTLEQVKRQLNYPL